MKYLSFFILISLFSCNSEKEEFIKIKKEYSELTIKYDSVQTLLNSIEARLIAVPKSNKVIIGEQYEADIFLVPYTKKNYPSSVFYYTNPNSHRSDTLNIVSNEEYAMFKFTPEELGEYKVRGEFRQKFLEKEYDMVFEMYFEVVSK